VNGSAATLAAGDAPASWGDVMAVAADADAIRDFLLEHPPFDRMERAHLDFVLSRLKPLRFADGEAVTDPEAGPAEWLYILYEGRIVGEEQGEDERVSGNAWELLPGECFPIGALLDERPVRNIQRADGDVVCLTMDRATFETLREQSRVFEEFCQHRLGGLVEQARRHVQAEAVRDLGGDTSLNIALKEKTLREPLACPPDAPIRSALEGMSREKVGSIVVVDGERRPIGIFTMKDLMNRVALRDVPLEAEMGSVMSPDPVVVPRSTFAFEAAMLMAHNGIHHLCVVDDDGRIEGVISERDLFSMQRVGLVNLTKTVGRATRVSHLATIASDIRQLVAQMMAQGVKVGQITQMITLLNDQIVSRVIELTLPDHPEVEGIDFAWIAFGSEGRHEQNLNTDQDNGILFTLAKGESADAIRERLLPFADQVNRALDEIGFTLCPAEIMARNPESCLAFDEWKGQFARWIDQGTPEHLLKASIFFDFRRIWGPEGGARDLRAWLMEKAAKNTRFQRQMAENALSNTPPLGGFFRDFRLSGQGEQSNTIDLKINGVAIFIDAARIWSLARKVPATATVDRFEAVAEKGAFPKSDLAAWTDAYDYIRMLRMRINQEQAAAGLPLSNRVAPDKLNDLDRRILKEAFREARRLQAKLGQDYQL
jgi:CBS domain-containing protein